VLKSHKPKLIPKCIFAQKISIQRTPLFRTICQGHYLIIVKKNRYVTASHLNQIQNTSVSLQGISQWLSMTNNPKPN
jgi:hypothetical protein